jgi:predicted Fe-S protein YdhL (DUF1289 family)
MRGISEGLMPTTMTTAGEPIATPCIGVCEIDQDRGLCKGCLRTIGEIAAWSRLSNPERRRIMSQLSLRQGQSGAEGRFPAD